MSFLHELDRQFRYDRWANAEVLANLQRLHPAPLRSVSLLAHILAAEALWLARLQGKPAPLPVWPDFDLAECARRLEAVAAAWHDHLAGLSDAALEAGCEYSNSKGERFTSRVADILTHVVMHSCYHRGQIAADVRAAGATPAYTDFIHAVRQGWVGSSS